MNNTTISAIAAVLMAATLVLGGTLAATSAQSAFAYQNKRGHDDSKDGNTVTIQATKQKGSVSGFDNTAEQEAQNVICTHPGENATCTSEGAAAGGGGGGGGNDDNIVCPDGLIRANILLHLVPERILGAQVCVFPGGTVLVPGQTCTVEGTVGVAIGDANFCSRLGPI
jgi:hypothetical protein